MPGKVDWMARGLPLEGEKAREPRAVDVAHQDVVTCDPGARVGALRDRVEQSPYGFALVLGPGGVVFGRLRRAVLQGDASALAEEVMEPGPSTTRPDTAPEQLLSRLQKADLTTAILTDPEGRLLGIVRRDALEAAAADR
jgi:CBS domain-containing protein